MRQTSSQDPSNQKTLKDKDLLNYREDESYIKVQKQLMEYVTTPTPQRLVFRQKFYYTLPINYL